MRLSRLLPAALFLIPALAANAVEIVIFESDFDEDGVLPSDSGIFYTTGPGSPVESDVYSVSDGLLTQTQLGQSGRAYYQVWDEVNPGYAGPLPDSTLDLVIDARVRINAIDAQTGVFLQAFDGVDIFSLNWQPGGLCFGLGGNTAGTPCPDEFTILVDEFDQFHDYRLETSGGSGVYSIFIDDVLRLTTTAVGQTTFDGRGFGFGNGLFGPGGANADFDFIRISQFDSSGGPPVPVPEPGTLALLSFGLFGMSLATRRKKA